MATHKGYAFTPRFIVSILCLGFGALIALRPAVYGGLPGEVVSPIFDPLQALVSVPSELPGRVIDTVVVSYPQTVDVDRPGWWPDAGSYFVLITPVGPGYFGPALDRSQPGFHWGP